MLPSGAHAGTLFSTSVVSIDPAVDGAGNLFLYQRENDGHILSYLGENLDVKGPGATITVAGDDYVEAMTLDAAGDLFLATPGQIVKVLPSQLSVNPAPGITGTVIPAMIDGDSFTLDDPSDLVVDGAGDIIIADTDFARLLEIPAGGGDAFVINPVVDGKRLLYPTAVAFDLSGNLYVLDAGNSRIVEIQAAQTPSLSFAMASLGYISPDSPKVVPIQNVGTSPLTFTAITYPPDFPEQAGGADPCTTSTSLQPGQICNLNIDFQPQTAGNLTGTVQITDNSLNRAGATQTVSVSGTSPTNPISVSATSLSYPSTEVGNSSLSQQFTLTNYGTTPLTLVGFPITGANASSFVFGSTCTATLPPNQTCIIHGHFAPKSPGSVTATLVIEHHDAGPSQTVTLTGTGVAGPKITFSSDTLSFGAQTVGTSSMQTLTLTNTGEVAVSIGSNGIGGDSFSETDHCPSTLSVGASCTFAIYFTPKAKGAQSSELYILDSANNLQGQLYVFLNGTGQ